MENICNNCNTSLVLVDVVINHESNRVLPILDCCCGTVDNYTHTNVEDINPKVLMIISPKSDISPKILDIS